jgi:hypothetical protein
MVVIFQVKVSCIVTPCSTVVGYQRFRGLYCPHLQGKVAGMEEEDTDVVAGWRRVAGATSQ